MCNDTYVIFNNSRGVQLVWAMHEFPHESIMSVDKEPSIHATPIGPVIFIVDVSPYGGHYYGKLKKL